MCAAAASPGSPSNPIIQPFYARLRAHGNSKKVARCAAARKLVHIAWAVATKGHPFDPHYHTGGAPDATTA